MLLEIVNGTTNRYHDFVARYKKKSVVLGIELKGFDTVKFCYLAASMFSFCFNFLLCSCFLFTIIMPYATMHALIVICFLLFTPIVNCFLFRHPIAKYSFVKFVNCLRFFFLYWVELFLLSYLFPWNYDFKYWLFLFCSIIFISNHIFFCPVHFISFLHLNIPKFLFFFI